MPVVHIMFGLNLNGSVTESWLERGYGCTVDAEGTID